MKNITLFNQVNLLQSFCKRMATATTSCAHSYKRYYLLLTILLFVGVNNAWAGAGFYEVYMTYSYNGTNSSVTLKSDANHTDLGILTADFTITGLYLKYWKDNSGNICGGLMDYYIDSDKEYQPSWTWYYKGSGNDRELQSTSTFTVAKHNGNSGHYTFWYRFKTWGSSTSSSACDHNNYYLPSNSNNKNSFNYTIAPPAVKSFAVTPSGDIISGSGTQADPYIIRYNGSLTLTLSGSQNHTDANSTIQYNASGTWNTTAVKTINKVNSTEVKNVTLKARYTNKTDATLSGTESSKTIYYRSEYVYTVAFDANGHGAAPTEQKISEGGKVTAPTEPTAEGYIFGGWYKESACINKWNFDTDIVNNDITLYAQWECALTEIQIEGTFAITQGGTISLRVADNPNITPQTTYLWKRGNEEVGNERTLTVSCELKNAGNYTCTVTNDHCSATNNFTVKYYHLKGFVEGDDNQDPDAWNTPREFVWDGEGNKATLSIELKGHTTYQFKLNDGTSWYWNEGTITYNNRTDWEIEQQGYDTSDKQNTKITTTAPGIYTFTLNYDDAAKPQLSVIYPEEQIVYLKPGVWDVDGAKFTIYSWSSLEYTPSKFTQMELADCNGNVYKANIDPAHDWVSFIRAENYVENWDADIWDRSLDLKILNDPQFEILKWADLDETFGNNKKKSSGKWSAYIPYYNISYNMNGHGTQISDACIQGGNSWSAPTDPTEVGYTFQGWRRPAATGDDKLYKLGSSGYTPTASETLTAQWDAIPKYTVSFSTGTDNPTQASITETKGGAGITLPTGPQPICTDWIFAGWWTEEVSSTNTSPGTLLKAGDNYNPTSNITLYAVYSTEEVGDAFTKYAKVTENLDDWSGKYLLSTGTYTATGAYDPNGTQGHLMRTEYTPGNEEKVEWEFTLTKIGTTGYSILFPDGSWYLGWFSSTNFERSPEDPSNKSKYLWTPTINGITNVYDSSRKISDNSSTDFRPYSNPSSNIVYLYKRVGGGSTTIYNSNPTCLVPVWNGADIDKTDFTVNCGERSPMEGANGAAKITFSKDKIYNFSSDITITASEGFLVSTSRTPNGNYKQSVFLSPLVGTDYPNTFNDKYVYVRAEAPTKSDSDLEGEITIKDSKGNTLQTIAVIADVSCAQYTLTFNDQGQTKPVEGFAGTTVEAPEPWAGICTEPIQYVFDGWAETPVANGTEEYDKINFSTYTMPDNNTTVLYAVYRYAEDGSEPVNGFVKVTEALSDWTGDYVIVNETAKKAIGNEYAYTNTLTAVDVEITDNHQVKSPTNNIIWQIRKHGEYYTMYNESARTYAYVDRDKTEGAGLSSTITGTTQDVQIIFNSGTAKVSGVGYYRCFYYNSDKIEWRTYATGSYNTGALYRLFEKTLRYTSSLVCGKISVEDDNVVVTSTKDQTVKVYVPITLEYSDAASITGTSNNEAFTIVTKNDVAIGESNIEVHYKPTVYVDAENQEETATITLTTSNGATTTFNVTGRCLPETFAIVAKVGNVWYALPSQGLNSETTPVGYPVEVDNNDNPTAVTAVPANADWSLRQVYASSGLNDRFTANGENLVFVNADNKTLYASKDNANIQTYAEYTNYAATNPDRYEWVPTTTDLTNYTLKNVERDKDLSINVNATFGTHASNIASNNLRFLPINATYNPFDMQVVEWYPTKVLVQTEAALTSVSATVGGIAVANPVVTKKGGKLYEISGLPLESNPTKILTISYDTYSCSKVIPIIISREEKTVTDAPFSTLTTSAYNYSDLVVRDGAKLTINGIEKTPDKFVNVTIYPTAKIVVPENTQLNVYSLTFISGITEVYDGSNYTLNKYAVPELSLKGKLGKTVTTMDYVMRVDLDQMYQMGVPYDVALSDITYGDGSPIKLGTQLYVSAYDGQARANRESKTWVYETDFATKFGSATLKAGMGYTISAEPQTNGDKYAILRLPMKSNISSGSTEAAKTVAVKAYDNEKGVTITANHKGWNYLSNPYMTSISGAEADSKLVVGYLRETGTGPWEWVNDTYRYVTIPHNDGEDYDQQKFSEATLLPFKSFFLQIATDGEMSFALASRQNAPARYMEVQTEQEVEFEILLSNEKQSDNTGLLIAEQYSPAYEINADLEKMTGSMSVYTIYGGHKLAYNALSPINASEWIPMGYIVPTTGEYTFELDEQTAVEDIVHIYLIDYETGAITDLLDNTYTFDTSVKKSESRFAINVVLRSDAPGTATGIDNMRWSSDQPQKFIYNGMMYILHNGTIYDANGQQVKTINK